MSFLSRAKEFVFGKKPEADAQEPDHLGPVSAPPGSKEASQARIGQLTETLGQQGQPQVGESYETPPKPVEAASAPLTPTAAPTREATPIPTPTSAPRVEIPTPAAGPKPSPNTTSGTGEKAA